MKKYLSLMIKITFVIYLIATFFILFLGQRGHWSNFSITEYALMQINIVPFKTIIEYIHAILTGSMNVMIPIKNLVGNLVLFLPMGIYLPLFFKKSRSFKSFLLIVFAILLSIELIQFITKRGAFDIDDLILNLSGASIGLAIWKSKLGQTIQSKIQ